jgi:hypothetical protein
MGWSSIIEGTTGVMPARSIFRLEEVQTKFKLTHVAISANRLGRIGSSQKCTPITTKDTIKQGDILLTLQSYLNPHPHAMRRSSVMILAVIATLVSPISATPGDGANNCPYFCFYDDECSRCSLKCVSFSCLCPKFWLTSTQDLVLVLFGPGIIVGHSHGPM